jgi:hypothetical protein
MAAWAGRIGMNVSMADSNQAIGRVMNRIMVSP